MQFLTQNIKFPNVNEATSDGLLAIGGDLSVERLIYAYKQGIFPWYNEGDPILWWSPNPRFVLFPKKLKISKSMKQVLRNKDYVVTKNKDFKGVITECSKIKREGQADTWITNKMIEAYVNLHNLGFATSVEVWENNELVGGFYGVDLGNGVFCGESMFAKVSNASKIAFITFIQNTDYKLIDCQVYTNHLESLGAEEIPRHTFIEYLNVP
ncbi:leucyl/phenylalanyl-tRNA--protein transferase [Mariniflexile fucanivorans]|uniref:Leucyl/phenylalanyl-tRNA--protein transferase n=1 Tax=Mariniflexile fucanivorans TaxID=264023 RepID=A0A4V2QEP4_9FLAO|nr:leucyl/phenylalanyl-tRNA--protein transferase [Mariniflexile fucanivorans]TCL68827.1 leucyl/phenylalanyl-tRNA--protein transferase [Mariniflexile fucanivorans]